MHGKRLCLHWKPRIFCSAFGDSRFSVLCASFIFSENTVLGIGRMPRYFMSAMSLWSMLMPDYNILYTLSDSAHEGTGQAKLGSADTVNNCLLNKSNTESIIRMIRCGGFASLRTVEM